MDRKTSVRSAEKLIRHVFSALECLRIAVVKQDLKVEQGKVKAYRTRVLSSFKYGS